MKQVFKIFRIFQSEKQIWKLSSHHIVFHATNSNHHLISEINISSVHRKNGQNKLV